jgi:AraC-like DNA-binding protein
MSMRPPFLRDSPEPSLDPLSEVLRLIEVHGAVSGGFSVGGAWTTRFELSAPLKFVGMVRGSAVLHTDGAAPVDIGTGDVVVLNNRRWVTLSGGPGNGVSARFTVTEQEPFLQVDGGGDDVVLGGHIGVNRVGEELFDAALPPVVHVRAAAPDAAHLRHLLEGLYDEVSSDRVGGAFAVSQHSQLLVLAMLRAYLAQADELPAGWLRVLADDRLRPAVRLMHAEPGQPWRLEEMARAAAMSRTSFAERFREVAGVPPLMYLNTWRMRLAQQALRNADIRIGPLAVELGYTSESAFSSAFKRTVGVSPRRYRAEVAQK